MTDAAACWRDFHRRTIDPADGLPAVVAGARNDLFSDWQQLHAPYSRASRWLDAALCVAALAPSHPLVAETRGFAEQVSDRALADPRWATTWSRPGLGERERLLVSVTRAFAVAWRNDSELDAEVLIAAARTCAAEAATGSYWDIPEQTDLIAASQLALCVSDVAAARALLKTRRKFGQVRRYWEWYVDFLTRLESSAADDGAGRDAVRVQFDEYFDLQRGPGRLSHRGAEGEFVAYDAASSITSLRLALIRWRHVERRTLAGHWNEVIEQISR